ncbi:LPS assembly lipoprotein LptE [Billgrantia saliphila]|uniref:LPS-assembly lipoprotein LptE n=1 Tax=Billgrantia saliphila TaxID=1848458 RepID=UPI000CE523D1|nr:LPS assembly lipoprotein LptE [Halomonas saliphila]
MQRRSFLTLALAGGASLAFAGCGFRLRGFDDSGPVIDQIALAGVDSEFLRMTEEHLIAAGTRVHDDAPLVLNLGEETVRERSLSVLDSGSRELEITLALPFSVQRRRDGAFHLQQQRLEASTRISVNDDNLLAQDDLREEAHQELRREALRQLLERLRALEDASP